MHKSVSFCIFLVYISYSFPKMLTTIWGCCLLGLTMLDKSVYAFSQVWHKLTSFLTIKASLSALMSTQHELFVHKHIHMPLGDSLRDAQCLVSCAHMLPDQINFPSCLLRICVWRPSNAVCSLPPHDPSMHLCNSLLRHKSIPEAWNSSPALHRQVAQLYRNSSYTIGSYFAPKRPKRAACKLKIQT